VKLAGIDQNPSAPPITTQAMIIPPVVSPSRATGHEVGLPPVRFGQVGYLRAL
jgi:hypothetical protein